MEHVPLRRHDGFPVRRSDGGVAGLLHHVAVGRMGGLGGGRNRDSDGIDHNGKNKIKDPE